MDKLFSAEVIADSISPANIRLLTLQLKYPRWIHGELMTHRVFSRNAASSRAIPIQKMIDQVLENPALPVHWGKNQPGMQARQELTPEVQEKAIAEWLRARNSVVEHARNLVELGVHKQVVNRILEPFQLMQTIVTATEWDNFFALRIHEDAQPEIKKLAELMKKAMDNSTPSLLTTGEWHLPYVMDEEKALPIDQQRKLSTARCARVSYLNHDRSNPDPAKDVNLHDRLYESGHFSPFEHQARPALTDDFYANFRGWESYRFRFEHLRNKGQI